MRIAGIEIEALRLPFRRALVLSQRRLAERRSFRLRLRSADGVEGYGEAGPAYWLGEGDLEQTREELATVARVVAGGPSAASLRERFLAEGRAATPLEPAAAAALDSALLDLAARADGLPMSALLGGDGGATLGAAALLTGDAPDELAATAVDAVALGFRTLKIKVGSAAVDVDCRRVAAVRARVGTAVALRLDGNRAWDLATARRALAAVAPLAIEFVEEPLRHPEPAAIAALQASTAVPLALDESVRDRADLGRLLDAGVRPTLVLKPARLGGPTRTIALARFAQECGLAVVVTDSIETAVGMGAAVHTGAALAAPRPALGLGGGWLLTDGPSARVSPFPAPTVVACGPGLDVRVPSARDA